MKPFIIILKVVTIFVLFEFKTVESQNKRLWLEIGRELFYVDPEPRYNWKKAVAACRKDHTNLIEPKGDFDYAKLKDEIKHNFKNYSSLWTSAQVNSNNIFHHFGLGKEEYDRKKCYKFDNSSTFRFLPEDCNTHLGFICEKPLLNGQSSYQTKTMMYFIQPKQEFNCDQVYEQCEKRQMFLVTFKDQVNNKLLKDYLFYNYGLNTHFWFGSKKETHNNCETMAKSSVVNYNSKLGFVCQKIREEKHGLTGRHIILLIFVAVAAFIAVIVFSIIKFRYLKSKQSFEVLEAELTKGIKLSEIK